MTTLAACGHMFERHSDELGGRWCSDCRTWCTDACYVGDMFAPHERCAVCDDWRSAHDETDGSVGAGHMFVEQRT